MKKSWIHGDGMLTSIMQACSLDLLGLAQTKGCVLVCGIVWAFLGYVLQVLNIDARISQSIRSINGLLFTGTLSVGRGKMSTYTYKRLDDDDDDDDVMSTIT